jgi:hypothetical protein
MQIHRGKYVKRSSCKCQREETSSIGEELNQMYLQWTFNKHKKGTRSGDNKSQHVCSKGATTSNIEKE